MKQLGVLIICPEISDRPLLRDPSNSLISCSEECLGDFINGPGVIQKLTLKHRPSARERQELRRKVWKWTFLKNFCYTLIFWCTARRNQSSGWGWANEYRDLIGWAEFDRNGIENIYFLSNTTQRQPLNRFPTI